MVSLLGTLVLFLSALLPATLATPPNPGITAYIDPASVTITPTNGRLINDTPPTNATNVNDTAQLSQLVRLTHSIEYAFQVPISLSRGASLDMTPTVSVLIQPYDGDEDVQVSLQEEVTVYQDFIDFDGQSDTSIIARFNFSVSARNTTVFVLRAVVNSTVTGFGRTDGYIVTAHDVQSSTWTSTFRSEYDAQVNDAITAEFDSLDANSEPGEDTTSETVIDDPPGELPGDDGTTTGTTDGSGDGTGNSTTTCPCATEKHKPTYKTKEKSWPHHPHSKPNESPCTTPTPTPTPSPPCETGKDKWYHPRQAKAASNLILTLTFGLDAKSSTPIRQLPVYAWGTPSNGGKAIKATGKTNNQGRAVLRWNLPPGVSVTVGRLYVQLNAEGHRITSSTDKQTFKTITLNTVKTNYVVNSGDTVDKTFRWVKPINIEYFNVHERALTVHVWVKSNIRRFYSNVKDKIFEKIPIWYPGETTEKKNSYFTPYPTPFLSIYPGEAKYTTTIGHEMGHWIHYLARKKQQLNAGGYHTFCNYTVPESEALAMTEGYATALAILAFRGSKYAPGDGTSYCWSPSDAPKALWDCRGIENYDCSAIAEADRNLSTDEGRVAAAILDLADFLVDDNLGITALGVNGKTDNSNLRLSRVLYWPMRNNPASMQEYW